MSRNENNIEVSTAPFLGEVEIPRCGRALAGLVLGREQGHLEELELKLLCP